MPRPEGASAVYSGVLHDTPAGAIAVWVTRNGVRRIGGVTPEMIEEGNWDPDGHPTLSVALHQLDQYFNRRRERFHLQLDFSGATPFQRRIFERLTDIPYGGRGSYGVHRRRDGSGGRRARGRSGRGSQSSSDRRSMPSRGPERRKARRLLGGPPPESRPSRHRGCGRRRAPTRKPGSSGIAAAFAVGRAHLNAYPDFHVGHHQEGVPTGLLRTRSLAQADSRSVCRKSSPTNSNGSPDRRATA